MSAEGEPERVSGGTVHSATIACEVCGRETSHRILRIARHRDGAVDGLARCRECRTTHPFRSVPAKVQAVRTVVSTGARSTSTSLELDPASPVHRGDTLPVSPHPLEVRRIESRRGRDVESARPDEIETLWVIPRGPLRIPVSIVEGRRTLPSIVEALPETRLEVGQSIVAEGRSLEIVAIRARGSTWRLGGDGFPAGDVQRLYTRRAVNPPAGRRDWSRSRGSPSSWASSTSRAARSRSSPGVRRARTSP